MDNTKDNLIRNNVEISSIRDQLRKGWETAATAQGGTFFTVPDGRYRMEGFYHYTAPPILTKGGVTGQSEILHFIMSRDGGEGGLVHYEREIEKFAIPLLGQIRKYIGAEIDFCNGNVYGTNKAEKINDSDATLFALEPLARKSVAFFDSIGFSDLGYLLPNEKYRISEYEFLSEMRGPGRRHRIRAKIDTLDKNSGDPAPDGTELTIYIGKNEEYNINRLASFLKEKRGIPFSPPFPVPRFIGTNSINTISKSLYNDTPEIKKKQLYVMDGVSVNNGDIFLDFHSLEDHAMFKEFSEMSKRGPSAEKRPTNGAKSDDELYNVNLALSVIEKSNMMRIRAFPDEYAIKPRFVGRRVSDLKKYFGSMINVDSPEGKVKVFSASDDVYKCSVDYMSVSYAEQDVRPYFYSSYVSLNQREQERALQPPTAVHTSDIDTVK
jgi:hypothetical protein